MKKKIKAWAVFVKPWRKKNYLVYAHNDCSALSVFPSYGQALYWKRDVEEAERDEPDQEPMSVKRITITID